ncbi:MAG: hypothetical protein MUF78_06805 [Candidatus Edwardsbacteria bacterium]|nr:hypothetical protein [Candidatus Edwardsbacteria bacterium]
MKINLTIIVSILLVAGLLALGFTSWQVYQERQRSTWSGGPRCWVRAPTTAWSRSWRRPAPGRSKR